MSTEKVQWADSGFVVYAINDQTSFDLARTIVEYVYSVSVQNQLPVALVANKSDMLDRKEVSDTEVSRLCAEFNLFFFETSASESRKSVADLFTTLSRQVRHIMKKREKLTSLCPIQQWQQSCKSCCRLKPCHVIIDRLAKEIRLTNQISVRTMILKAKYKS